jgi:hypothetical protein
MAGVPETPVDSVEPGDVTERGKRWNRASEDTRSRAEISAKALGGLGTAALSAVGIAKFGDLFPLPAGDMGFPIWAAVVAVPIAFFVMAYVIVHFSLRLGRATEPIFMRANPAEIEGLNKEEKERVEAVYALVAGLHGYESLQEYEQAAITREIEARETSPAERDVPLKEAETIRADVDEAQQRALLNVTRMRTKDSVKGTVSKLLYVTFAVALVVFAIGADYLDSERSARVAAAKACADAADAIRRGAPRSVRLLPPICGKDAAGALEDDTPAATSSGELTGSAKELAARWDACRTAAKAGDAADELECARIRRALVTVLDP